ncbi:MAG: nucleotidyltransferase family protein [Actinomycetota bacterium]
MKGLAPINVVARTLVVDATAAEVFDALRGRGVGCILLKGATIGRWLYDDEPRRHNDCDVLVSPLDIRRAEAVLGQLGFHPAQAVVLPHDRPTNGRPWIKDGYPSIDLHGSVWGFGVDAQTAWRVLLGHTESFELASCSVEALVPAARALLVALHAVHHGPRWEKPLEDLVRAVTRLSEDIWRDATVLAQRLDATEAMGAGLRLVGPGADLATRLGLPTCVSREVRLMASTAPSQSVKVEWFAQLPGLRTKAAFLVGKVFPPVAFMRDWSPLARRGPVGLAAAYAWRFLWLARVAPPAFRAWRRARRGSRVVAGCSARPADKEVSIP